MTTIPPYINCKTNTESRAWIMHRDCPNMCSYVRSLGIGAMTVSPVKRSRSKLGEGTYTPDDIDYFG